MKAIVYSLAGCPYCTKAKAELRKAKIPIAKEHKIRRGDAPIKLPDGRTSYTFPQIYFYIGGYGDLTKTLG